MYWLNTKCLDCGHICETHSLKTVKVKKWWWLYPQFKSVCPECGSDNLESIGYFQDYDENGKPIYGHQVPTYYD
jgi:ribosomal protein S27E